MRRAILPALLLLLFVLPSMGQFGFANRDAQRTVENWYRRFLGRQTDPWAAGWVQALRQGQDPDQVLAGILGSDEYFRRAGGTPRAFVRQLYSDLMGRRPTAREEDFFVRQMWSSSRADVAFSILTRSSRNWDDWDRNDWRDRNDFRRPVIRFR